MNEINKWSACLNEDGSCLSFAYYGQDGVVSDCSLELVARDVDKLSIGDDVFYLTCGQFEDKFIAGNMPNDTSIPNLIAQYGPTLRPNNGAFLILDINNTLLINAAKDWPADKAHTFVKVRTRNGEDLLFKTRDDYSAWVKTAGEAEVAEKKIYLMQISALANVRRDYMTYDSADTLSSILNLPEAFIFGKDTYKSRAEFKGALEANPADENTEISITYLVNGSSPRKLTGKVKDLIAYAEMLVQEESGKKPGAPATNPTDEKFDVRLKLSFPQGEHTTDNRIKDSPVFKDSEFAQDFRNAQNPERSNYYSPFGAELSFHWWAVKKGIFRFGLGLADELSFRFAGRPSAYSNIGSNLFSLDIPFAFKMGSSFRLEVNPVDFGVLTLFGNSIHGSDTSVKKGWDETVLTYNPSVAGVIKLTDSLDLTLGFEFRQPIYGRRLSQEYVPQVGLVFPFGRDETYDRTPLVDAPYTPPPSPTRKVLTTIEMPAEVIPEKADNELPASPPLVVPLTVQDVAPASAPELSLSGLTLFKQGKSTLTPEARKAISDWLFKVKESDNVRTDLGLPVQTQYILLEGYTNSDGDDDANKKLSERRAGIVRNEIIALVKRMGAKNVPSIRPENILNVGFGEDPKYLIRTGAGDEDKTASRRTEVKFFHDRPEFLAKISEARGSAYSSSEIDPAGDDGNLGVLKTALEASKSKYIGQVFISEDQQTVNIVVELPYRNDGEVKPLRGVGNIRAAFQKRTVAAPLKGLSRNVAYRFLIKPAAAGASDIQAVNQSREAYLQDQLFTFGRQPMRGNIQFTVVPGNVSDIEKEFSGKAFDTPPADELTNANLADLLQNVQETPGGDSLYFFEIKKDVDKEFKRQLATFSKKFDFAGYEVFVMINGVNKDVAKQMATFMKSYMPEGVDVKFVLSESGAEDIKRGVYVLVGINAASINQAGITALRDTMSQFQ